MNLPRAAAFLIMALLTTPARAEDPEPEKEAPQFSDPRLSQAAENLQRSNLGNPNLNLGGTSLLDTLTKPQLDGASTLFKTGTPNLGSSFDRAMVTGRLLDNGVGQGLPDGFSERMAKSVTGGGLTPEQQKIVIERAGKALDGDGKLIPLPPDTPPYVLNAMMDGNLTPIVVGGAVVGFDDPVKGMCWLPDAVQEKFKGDGPVTPEPSANAAGAADGTQLGASANALEKLANGTDEEGKDSTTGGEDADDPGGAAGETPLPSNTADEKFVENYANALLNNNTKGDVASTDEASFDPGGNPGGRSAGGSNPTAFSFPGTISASGATATGGQSGTIANGDGGGLKGTEVKCKTKADCEAVAQSIKAASEGAALTSASPGTRPGEIRTIFETATLFGSSESPLNAAGGMLTGSEARKILESGDEYLDQLKADAGRHTDRDPVVREKMRVTRCGPKKDTLDGAPAGSNLAVKSPHGC